MCITHAIKDLRVLFHLSKWTRQECICNELLHRAFDCQYGLDKL